MNLSKYPQDLQVPYEAPLVEMPFLEEEQPSDPREQMELFWRRKWLVIGVFLAVFAGGMVYTFTRQPIYQATTKLAVVTNKETGSSSPDDSLLASLENLDKTRNVDTQIEILKSQDLLDEAYAKIPAADRTKGFASDTIPLWAYNIDSRPDSDVVDITTNAYTPKLAAALSQQIAETYLAKDQAQNTQATRTAREYVQTAQEETRKDLSDATRRLAEYKQKSGLIASDVQVSQVATQFYQYQSELSTAKTARGAAERLMRQIGSQIKKTDPTIPFSNTIQENPDFSFVRNRLSQLRSNLNELLQEYTETAPEVVQVKNQIAENESQLKRISQSIMTSRQSQRNPLMDKLVTDYAQSAADQVVQTERIKTAQAQLAIRQKELQSYPERLRFLAQLQSQVDILNKTYEDLSSQALKLRVQESSTQPYGSVVSRARAPQFPAYPNKLQNVVAFFFSGLFLGILAAIIAEKLDNRLRDPYMVDRISNITSLTAVPETSPADALPEGRLILGHVENNHAFLESFRLLRNNIAFSSPDRKLKILAITSPSKAEGKSTVSVNLAIAMAMDGKRVLLVDGDLRRPTIHTWMDLPRDIGLTTVVKGLCSLEEAIRPTAYENLDCLPSGPLPPNPTEFLNSQLTRQLLERLRDDYDAVIIDSPPSTGLSDIQVISTVADGIILVVTLDRTMKQYLMATVRMLRQAGAPLIGTVLNRIRYERSSYGYYSYYYYYSSYEEDGETVKKKKRRRKTKDETKALGKGA